MAPTNDTGKSDDPASLDGLSPPEASETATTGFTPNGSTGGAQNPAPLASDPAQAAAADLGEGSKPPNKVLVTLRKLNQLIASKRGTVQGWLLVFTGIGSKDKGTRQFSVVFIATFFGSLFLVSTLWENYWGPKREMELAYKMGAAFQRAQQEAHKRAAENSYRDSMLFMGRFTVELKDVPNQVRGRGVVNMAEMEIVALCDSIETKEFMEKNSIPVRSVVSSVLTPIDREELLSKDGKKKWRAIIQKELNRWLPKGQVEDVYISRLIMN